MKHTITVWYMNFIHENGREYKVICETKKRAEKTMEEYSRYSWTSNLSINEDQIEVAITPDMKKEYQKLIKEIREKDFGITRGDYRGNSLYPKPMMTAPQMEKGQATINCGEWDLEATKTKAERIMKIESFKAFLEKYEATAKIEYDKSKEAYQIRIQF